MGVLVAFWSPLHGRGTTSNCIAAAMQFSYRYEGNIMISHTHYTRSTMEAAFLKGSEDEDLLKFNDMGIDSIERAIQTSQLTASDFRSYCHKVNKNVFMLSGSKKVSVNLYNTYITNTFENICKKSKELNDITFIDVESGFTRDIAKKVINIADIVVVTLDQTHGLCKDFFRNQINLFDPTRLIVCLGRYDWESKYNKKFVDNYFKTSCFIIPQLTDYLDALNNHKVAGFFERNHNLSGELFFEQLDGLTEEIADRAELLTGTPFIRKDVEQMGKRKFFFRR